MSAHATQVVVGPTGRAFSLSNKMVLPVLGAEHYVLVAGRPGPVGEHGWETDLLAGLELSGNQVVAVNGPRAGGPTRLSARSCWCC